MCHISQQFISNYTINFSNDLVFGIPAIQVPFFLGDLTFLFHRRMNLIILGPVGHFQCSFAAFHFHKLTICNLTGLT